MDEVRSARRALGSGATAEALVHLWNALEPARLSGDRGSLRAIGGIAQEIRARGDESEAREAERLLEALHETVDDASAPATGRLDAGVVAGGEDVVQDEAEAAAGGLAGRIGNLVWIAVVLFIVLINVIGQLRDGG